MKTLSEGEIVAAFPHVDADADGRLAIDPEHLRGRIAVAALDLGNVRQFVETTVDPEVEIGDTLRREEGAGDVDEHVFMRRIDHAGRHYRVLPGNRGNTSSKPSSRLASFCGGEVQINLLVLVAVNLDLADVGNAQEFGPCCLGEVACFAGAEAVIGDAIDNAEDIAELVVEKGTNHSLR